MQISEEQLREIFEECCLSTAVEIDGMYKNIDVMPFFKFRIASEKILALGKPRPLTKNKQFDEFTDCWRCGDKAVRQNLCLECRDIVFKDV